MRRTAASKTLPPIFVGRWTTEILFSLHERPHRHGQLQRRLGSVSQRMLTRSLRNLQSAGLITRSLIGSDARAVEYSLTRLGKTFIVPLTAMCKWARKSCMEVTAELCLTEIQKEDL